MLREKMLAIFVDCLCDESIEEKAKIFSEMTEKPIDKTDLEWYNEYRN